MIPPGEKIIEKKICLLSGQEFFITDKDLEFYDKISPMIDGKKYAIPSPTLCPDERQRRRLCFRNERKLYHRKCDKTGNQIISIYSPDKPYTVYDQKVWWSDNWSAFDYGMKFDFEKGFFEQFGELFTRVPLLSTVVINSENSEYSVYSHGSKNVYLGFRIGHSQDVYYSYHILDHNGVLLCTNYFLLFFVAFLLYFMERCWWHSHDLFHECQKEFSAFTRRSSIVPKSVFIQVVL